MMFAGLTSRCTMPWRWAKLRAALTWLRMPIARAAGSGPSRSTKVCRSTPSTYSIAKYGTPAGPNPLSRIETVLAWASRRVSSTSRAKRARSCALLRSGCRTLIAAPWPSVACRAL
jgi:hypothetical protein